MALKDMMQNEVFIAPSSFGECGRDPLDLLEKNGFRYRGNPYRRKLNEEELLALAKNCTGIIAGVEQYSDNILSQLPLLKVISRCGVGLENVPLKKTKDLGIQVFNTPDGPTESVAEFTLGLMLSLLRKISEADRLIKEGAWQKKTGRLLKGKTVGIIGFGRIGRRVSELLKPFGVKIIIHDPYISQITEEVEQVGCLKDLLQQADIVSLHLAWQDEEKPLLGREQFSWMKSGSFLINVSRGTVLDEEALYESLQEGNKILSGAALDVFRQEPYVGKLAKLPNVVLTPHIGSYASEAKLMMEIQAVENLMQGLRREKNARA